MVDLINLLTKDPLSTLSGGVALQQLISGFGQDSPGSTGPVESQGSANILAALQSLSDQAGQRTAAV